MSSVVVETVVGGTGKTRADTKLCIASPLFCVVGKVVGLSNTRPDVVVCHEIGAPLMKVGVSDAAEDEDDRVSMRP